MGLYVSIIVGALTQTYADLENFEGGGGVVAIFSPFISQKGGGGYSPKNDQNDFWG